MRARTAALIALGASALGVVFAAYSTYDYAQQLDRQVHAVHCSFIPGAPVSSDADNPCKAALFSAPSSGFRGSLRVIGEWPTRRRRSEMSPSARHVVSPPHAPSPA